MHSFVKMCGTSRFDGVNHTNEALRIGVDFSQRIGLIVSDLRKVRSYPPLYRNSYLIEHVYEALEPVHIVKRWTDYYAHVNYGSRTTAR